MNLQKINWKLYFENPGDARPSDFFKVFNTWIPNSPEIFVDVADYQHVHDGPLVFLAGHYVDYGLDEMEGKRGFLYGRKKGMEGNNTEKIEATLKEFLKKTESLVNDQIFEGKLKIRTNEFLFLVNDRALAPNNEETYKAIKPDLECVATKIYGKGNFSLKHHGGPSKRFSVTISSSKPPQLKDFLKKI